MRLVVAAIGLAVVAGACRDGAAERSHRARGTAVWVDPSEAVLVPSDRRALTSAGIEEVFLEAATVEWRGGEARLQEVAGALAGAVPAGTPVTLVVRGPAPAGDGVDPASAGRSLAPALRDLRRRAEDAGLLPVGLHAELSASEGDPLPELFRSLRRSLGGDLLLSTTLPGDPRQEERFRPLAAAVDFFVAFAYGQPPDAADDAAAWDPTLAAERVAALDALGHDYVVGLYVVGRAEHVGSSGERRTATTRAELKTLAQDPSLRLSIDDPFAGVGRLVHTFQAQGPSHAAGWAVAPGEAVRVIRTAPALVRELLDRLGAAGLEHHVGEVFYRVAGPDEDLSLSAPEIAAVAGGGATAPDLGWRVVVQSAQNDSVELAIELTNRSRQSTDLAATDGNFLQVHAEGGYFDDVDPGGFSRYTLRRGDREVRPGLGWREPDGVRLYTPMVRGGERIGGAILRLRTRDAEPRIEVTGRFFLPDGRELELPVSGGPLKLNPEGLLEGPETEWTRNPTNAMLDR